MTERLNESIELATELNLDTGRISWPELQRYFAAGRMLLLNSDLDLVKVAALFVEDDKDAVKSLLNKKQLNPASIGQARHWQVKDTEFWAVVVAPWVLAQEITRAAD